MRSVYKKLITLAIVCILFPIPEDSSGYSPGHITGKVVDYFTKKPIRGAIVTIDNETALTGENGFFKVIADAPKAEAGTFGYMKQEPGVKTPLFSLKKVGARAIGYARAEQDVKIPSISPRLPAPVQIELVPFTPKALYLSFYGIGSRILKESALKLIKETELNALVIDVKGDRGIITYKSSIPLAAEIGAQKLTIIKDIKTLIQSLKEKEIYTAYCCLQRRSPCVIKAGVSIKDALWRNLARQRKSRMGRSFQRGGVELQHRHRYRGSQERF
jgi:hypothetical protein